MLIFYTQTVIKVTAIFMSYKADRDKIKANVNFWARISMMVERWAGIIGDIVKLDGRSQEIGIDRLIMRRIMSRVAVLLIVRIKEVNNYNITNQTK